MDRRQLLRLAASSALPLITPLAPAQSTQSKPLTIYVGYAAGSSVDLVARQTALRLAPVLRRTVLVENRPGAAGQLALAALTQGPTDGSLIAFTPPSMLSLYPLTYDKLPYDPVKDIVPIASTCTSEACFVVAASHPATSLAEFVKWAKGNPASIGNAGQATGPHFYAWRFARAAGIDVQYVPYRAITQMAVEVASGQLSAGLAAVPAFMEMVRAGRLRMLATTGRNRASQFPQVPTFAEAGYPDVIAEDWYGFVSHSHVPDAVRLELEAALRGLMNDATYRQAIIQMGLVSEFYGAASLKQKLMEESVRWAELVKLTGFRAS